MGEVVTIDNDLLDRFEPSELRPPRLTPIHHDDFENRGGPPLSYPSSSSPLSKTFPPRALDPPKPAKNDEPSFIDRLVAESLDAAQKANEIEQQQQRVDTSPHTVVESRQIERPTTGYGILMLIIIWAIVARRKRKGTR